jgi:hypothetical protein
MRRTPEAGALVPVHKLALGPVFKATVLWDDTNMKEHLQTLPNRQLEDLWLDCQVSGDYDFQEQVFSVLLQRPDFCPRDYDLQWELEDAGWNGGATQDDRDAR